MSGRVRERFVGAIAGVGTTSGVRVVVGRWSDSPLGAFADVMLAEPDGTRWLLAPSREVADFVSSTYHFDRVVTGAVVVRGGESPGEDWWDVGAAGLELTFSVGRRPALGLLLRLVPRRLAAAPAWARVTDPFSRVLLRGVRTRGSAGGGRRESYGATDLHRVTSLTGTWQGDDVGDLAPVSPDPRFGFGSTPRRPSVTAVVTTVESD